MSKYQIALGYNNAAGLANILVQPATPSRIQYDKRNYAADGTTTPAGEPYVDLVYSILDNAEFPALNAQFGITLLVPDRQVTIRIKQDDGTFANYNAMIHYPENPQHSMAGWKVTYRVSLKEAL